MRTRIKPVYVKLLPNEWARLAALVAQSPEQTTHGYIELLIRMDLTAEKFAKQEAICG